jgi:hypothetical protein
MPEKEIKKKEIYVKPEIKKEGDLKNITSGVITSPD